MELSKKMSYEQITAALGKELERDPSKIRLTGHNSYYDQPKMTPLKMKDNLSLSEMLSPSSSSAPLSDCLYFEFLELPLRELENKREVTIIWREDNGMSKNVHKLLLPKEATVADTASELAKREASSQDENDRKIRILEVWNSKIYKILKPEDFIGSYNDFTNLQAEDIPPEELDMPIEAFRVQVIHFSLAPMLHSFGNPFFLVISKVWNCNTNSHPKNETVGEVKERIQQKFSSISPSEFARWKIAIVSSGKVKYLKECLPLFDVSQQLMSFPILILVQRIIWVWNTTIIHRLFQILEEQKRRLRSKDNSSIKCTNQT